MSKVSHSPLPWRLSDQIESDDTIGIFTTEADGSAGPQIGSVMLETLEADANSPDYEALAWGDARLIVRAVNSHDMLLAACELFVKYANENCQSDETPFVAVQQAVEAAIAKAKERP